jgi:hypothetical protein
MWSVDIQQITAPQTQRVCRLLEWKLWPFPNNSLIGLPMVHRSGYDGPKATSTVGSCLVRI